MKALEILIVEDHVAMRAALRDLLQSAHPAARILEAANGAEALESARQRRPALIVMDLMLPDALGVGLAAALLKLHPWARVIMVSHDDGADSATQALAAGVSAYIVKDRLHTELLPAVARLLLARSADGA